MSRPKSVYFYCHDDPWSLQEDVIAIAEGLRSLGVPFFGNCNYWRESSSTDSHLIQFDPNVDPSDCDVVVVAYRAPLSYDDSFRTRRHPLPPELFRQDRKYKTVYMDHHDGYKTISWEKEFRQFDLILRAHLNRRMWYPDNMRPWALGVTNRVIRATADATVWDERRKCMLMNFGASHPFQHGTRNRAARKFFPYVKQLLPLDETKDDLSREPAVEYDALMWKQTGKRFSSEYYERLKTSQSVGCFCGELIPSAPFRGSEAYLAGGGRARLARSLFESLSVVDPRPRRSVQWDSFRFWEALSAGCVAFNIDLEHYGVSLPEMPSNWVHYVGVNLENVAACLARLTEEPGALKAIAKAGRAWALSNYSPEATAKRFLDTVSQL